VPAGNKKVPNSYPRYKLAKHHTFSEKDLDLLVRSLAFVFPRNNRCRQQVSENPIHRKPSCREYPF